MGSDNVSVNNADRTEERLSDTIDPELQGLLDEYQSLLQIQTEERDKLLDKFDKIAEKTKDISKVDEKLEHLSNLLSDIHQQLAAMSKTQRPLMTKPFNYSKSPKIIATDEQIEQFSQEIDEKATTLDTEISTLLDLLESKKSEIKEKDIFIEKLNDKLDLVGDEKERLVDELENMNQMVDEWRDQLQLLQKLASSDPRYKVISTLKKHSNLSDIQLAFTLGTSINQLRKYIEDLVELNLVKKDESGRYTWIGSDVEGNLY